jgi:hypothetical protein
VVVDEASRFCEYSKKINKWARKIGGAKRLFCSPYLLFQRLSQEKGWSKNYS